jgi:hypothetical protein
MINRMAWRDSAPPLLTRDVIANIVKNQKLPSVFEQADNLIAYLALGDPGQEEEYDLHHGAIMGAKDGAGEDFIVQYLKQQGYIDLRGDVVRGWLRLTMKGWERADHLRRGAVNSRKAFMAMRFGDTVLDAVYEDFKEAVMQTGFSLFRLDEEPRAGLIDDRLRAEILASRFLIADLTHGNQGAYWEAGYAEGLGKPVIYTCEKKKFEDKTAGGTHFDTNHHLTVLWEPKDMPKACDDLKATIRTTLAGESKLQDDKRAEGTLLRG